jgi:monoterpene epsilon-lactone hydrolase
MQSLKSRLFLFVLCNRHLLQGKWKPQVIDWNTSTVKLREEFEAAAKKAAPIPVEIEITSVTIPGLPAGLGAEWIALRGSAPVGPGEKVIFYTHGGGYVSGSCADHRMHVAKFVKDTGVTALLYEYRLAPEHPFPAAVEDTLTAYRWLLATGVQPASIQIVGESAGGGLCLAALLALRDEGLPLPAAGVALSPWTDLNCTGASYRRNAKADISFEGSWTVWGKYYAGEANRENPWMSPLYGDLRGLPPILIVVGTAEILLDDAVSFARKAKEAGVPVTLRIWDGMVHCFPLFSPPFPEATQAWTEVCAYIRKHTETTPV